ncbi:MAG TPA: hypothetical protein VKR38_04125 [Usitatibacter sp.]|jgi:hypothetical protein|nr:hypothetical protein [Usitatibacter sp.]
MMPRITYELALGMALALEASESDMERIRALLHDRADAAESLHLAMELLARARRRIETVREALGEAAEPIFS